MALSRDLLGDLIADLERALPPEPAEASGYAVLPTLEDLQAVFTPIVSASKAEQARVFADLQYQHLYQTVMGQLRQALRQPNDGPIDLPVPRDLTL
jgi:hypothetical protein